MVVLLSPILDQLLLVSLLSFLGYRLFRAAVDPLRSIPGPFLARFSRLWYLGAVHKGDFEKQNIKLHRKHGPIVRVGPNMYSIDDPAAAATIYSTGNVFPKSRWYFTFQQPDEPNIFSTNNNKYAAEMRKKYKPAYDAFHMYEGSVDNCSNALVQKLSELSASGKNIDIGWWVTCFAFDVNGEITFSKRFGHLDKGEDIGGIVAALGERLDYVSHIGIYPFLHPILWKVIMALTFITNKVDSTYVFAERQIEDHQRRESEGGKSSGSPDMLDRFMKAHRADPTHFTKNDVLIGGYTSIVAGADTTKYGLSAAIHYLHKYPETLGKLRAEIDELAAKGRISDPVTFEETKKMPYLNAAIKEALRMHSPTGFPLWRIVPESGATLCGHYFPPGVTVGVNSWVAHYSSAFDPDPDVFRPERWLDASGEQLTQMNAAYMPFGLGPRNCQGQMVALMEMAKVIPQLLRRLEFEMSPEWETFNHWLVGHKGLNGKVKLRE